MKSEDKLESILQRLTYYNSSNKVSIVPTYDTIRWGKSKSVPFNLDLEDMTTDPIYWLDKLLETCKLGGVKAIALDTKSFASFIRHPCVLDLSKLHFKTHLLDYTRHLKSVWNLTGRWIEVGGRLFFESDCGGKTAMYVADYTVEQPSTIEGKIEQQLESLLLHLGDNQL